MNNLTVRKTNSEVGKFEKVRFDFTPTSLQEAMELAKILADSELVPTGYRGKPGNVLVAMNYGAELGLSGIQAVQGLAVINGKPSLYGDIGKALLLRDGCVIEESDVPEIKKTGTARCKITRPDGRTAERTFSVEDAKAAKLWGKSGAWETYPYRQMSWRAFWFAARDLCADLLKGMSGAEEMQDLQEHQESRPNSAPAIPALPGRLSEKAGNCQGLPRIVEVEADPVPTPGEPGSPSPATEAVETQAVEPEVASPNSENVEKVQEIVMYVEQVTGKADGSVYAIFGPRNQQFLTHEKSVAKVASDAKKANKIVKLTYVTASDKGAANGNYVCEISEYKP